MAGTLLPLLLVSAGTFLLWKLRGGPLLHPMRSLRILFSSGEEGRAKSLRALTLALAGTLGVGNITGVAYGIAVGGAGAVFWLFVSSAFSSVLKYAESALAKDGAKDGRGGLAPLLAATFQKRGKTLSAAYTLFCLLLCLSMGTALQSAAVYDALLAIIPLLKLPFALLFALTVSLFLRLGAERVEGATVLLIPFAVVLYTAMCFVAIGRHLDALPSVLRLILTEAFSPSAAVGGIFPVAVREGFASGLLSNEAGSGTSAIAHAHSDREAVFEGLSGATEVFFDTTVLCMLTAFTLLLSPLSQAGDFPTVCEVFALEFGRAGPFFLSFLIFLFALSTVLCWFVYGAESFLHVFPDRSRFPFYVLFLTSLVLGPFLPIRYLICASDLFLAVLTCLTLPVLVKKADRLVCLSAKSGLILNNVCIKRKSRILSKARTVSANAPISKKNEGGKVTSKHGFSKEEKDRILPNGRQDPARSSRR